MTAKLFRDHIAIGFFYVSLVCLLVCMSAGSAAGEDTLDSPVDALLKSMSSYLANTAELTVDTDLDHEVVTSDGEKLQLSSFASISIKRPSKLHMERKGMVADAHLIFDGETLTVYGEKSQTYGQLSGSGTIDDALTIFEMETGFAVPGSRILFSDPYGQLSGEIESSSYVGIGYVGGIKCHHLAFRKEKVDWQLWIQVGETPLPMKLIITSTFLASAPQYEIRFRNWNTNPKIDEHQFEFLPPAGVKKVDFLPTKEIKSLISADHVETARQTIQRKITRTEVTVPILPENCIPVVFQKVSLHNCEGIYYVLDGTQYVMVDVD